MTHLATDSLFLLRQINKNITLLFIAALSALALAGCGFKLKGNSAPLPFTAAQLQAASNSAVVTDLLIQLKAKNVSISSTPDAAVPRIALSNEFKDKTVLSTTTTGRVREYQLKQGVTVQVYGPAGQAWLDPVTLRQTRDFAYNDNQVLAKELEEQTLYKDMQTELILAIMRRLDATRSTALPPVRSADPADSSRSRPK